MFLLQGAQMLQMLEKSLIKSLPESLKVYGTVFHINHGNPFKRKVLVDKWPDFSTVVVRPHEQDMTDDLDHYTNTYQIYSRDPQNCQEFLSNPEVMNWNQNLQIQSSQSSLNEVVHALGAARSYRVDHSESFLYMTTETIKKVAPSLLDTKDLPPTGGKPKAINEDMFKLTPLDAAHAGLVNKFWYYGGNERSQRFIERCIRTFPTCGLRGPDGTLVSWNLMDYTGETRMAGTLPEYRAQGLVSYVVYSQAQTMERLGFPVYSHTDKSNIAMQKMSHSLHHIRMPCHWNQWKCVARNGLHFVDDRCGARPAGTLEKPLDIVPVYSSSLGDEGSSPCPMPSGFVRPHNATVMGTRSPATEPRASTTSEQHSAGASSLSLRPAFRPRSPKSSLKSHLRFQATPVSGVALPSEQVTDGRSHSLLGSTLFLGYYTLPVAPPGGYNTLFTPVQSPLQLAPPDAELYHLGKLLSCLTGFSEFSV
ncbi:glycine N-acyltransferase-like [Ctenodactylus gundi]